MMWKCRHRLDETITLDAETSTSVEVERGIACVGPDVSGTTCFEAFESVGDQASAEASTLPIDRSGHAAELVRRMIRRALPIASHPRARGHHASRWVEGGEMESIGIVVAVEGDRLIGHASAQHFAA